MRQYLLNCAIGPIWIECKILTETETHFHIVYHHPFEENTVVERIVPKGFVK